MRAALRLALSSTLAVLLFTGGSFTIASATETSSPRALSTVAAHVIDITKIHRAPTESVCSSDVPAGVAHCSAVIQKNGVNPHEQFTAAAKTALGLGDNGAYSPAFLQSAYNVQTALNTQVAGAGQIVAVVGAFNDPKLISDLAFYRRHYALPACPAGTVSANNKGCVVDIVNQRGSTPLTATTNNSWAMEAAIDTDMVSAICPTCQILFVEADTPTMVDLGASVNTAIKLGATVVSNSYGSAEYSGETVIANRYYSHKSVPVVVAAGEGATTAEFPASAPDVVAVGGTSLAQYSANGERDGYETAWGGTDSGCSKYEPKPAWQHDKGCANRSVADIAAVANPDTGVWIYDTQGASGSMIAGGTSVAAAIVASLFALAGDTYTASTYPVSYLYQNRRALYSVTSGASQGCVSYLCDAAHSQIGYNGLTGLGTPGGTPNSFRAFGAPNPPTTPVLRTAAAADGSVSLTWGVSSAKGQRASLGYRVYEGTSKGFTTNLVNDDLTTATALTVSGLTNNTTYYLSIQAVTYGGVSSLSNSLAATPVELTGEPGVPTPITVSIANGQVTVAWTAPADIGDSNISSYTVSDNEGDGCIEIVSAPEVDTCTFQDPINPSSDTFYVTATNGEGAGLAGTSTIDDAAPSTAP